MKQYFAFTVGVAMMLMALPSQAQDHTVSGTVVSAPDSQPLAGAAVIETGANNGTATAGDGSFSLEVDNPNASLTVSFIGFASQTVEIEGRTEINISLEIDTRKGTHRQDCKGTKLFIHQGGRFDGGGCKCRGRHDDRILGRSAISQDPYKTVHSGVHADMLWFLKKIRQL